MCICAYVSTGWGASRHQHLASSGSCAYVHMHSPPKHVHVYGRRHLTDGVRASSLQILSPSAPGCTVHTHRLRPSLTYRLTYRLTSLSTSSRRHRRLGGVHMCICAHVSTSSRRHRRGGRRRGAPPAPRTPWRPRPADGQPFVRRAWRGCAGPPCRSGPRPSTCMRSQRAWRRG